MKKVTVTIKLDFETDEVDSDGFRDLLNEAVSNHIGELIDNDELVENVKIKIVDSEPDEDEDPELEDDED